MVHHQCSCTEITITGANDVVTGHQNRIRYRGPENGMLIVDGHGNTIVRDSFIIGSLIIDGDCNKVGAFAHHMSFRGYNNTTIGDAVAGHAIIQWSHDSFIAALPTLLPDTDDDRDEDYKSYAQDIFIIGIPAVYKPERLRRYANKLFLKDPIVDDFLDSATSRLQVDAKYDASNSEQDVALADVQSPEPAASSSTTPFAQPDETQITVLKGLGLYHSLQAGPTDDSNHQNQ